MPKGGLDQRALAKRRIAAERGFVRRDDAPMRVCLCYPSPYRVAMSSLGFQTIFRELDSRADVSVDRAFVPDTREDVSALRESREPLLAYASAKPVGDFPIVGVSIAYELEVAGLFTLLDLAEIPVLAAERGPKTPLVILGGPFTFSNPAPLAPFADAIVVGEADNLINAVVDANAAAKGREERLAALARVGGVWVPSIANEPPPVARADDARLPAFARIVTDETELSGMFLVEAERGCHRSCTYCVMRRGAGAGMRVVPRDRVLARIPEEARRVGLVGAGVSDHPEIREIVRAVVERGREVSLSSLRADRLDAELVELLARGGHRTLTVAADAASERLRHGVERRIHERHLLRAAQLAREARMTRLKNYVMVGLPGETDADIGELIRFTRELAKALPVALGIAPFVAKRHTPLDGAPFEAIASLEAKLGRIRRELAGVAEVRPTSARWAWVEHKLAQGGRDAGVAALAAHRAGGSFAAYRRAFRGD